MQADQLIQTISLAAIPVLFAITLHEAAHGYVARHFGDMTAYQQGRISLNPLRHIDPVGTVLFPLLTLWLGGILFGWAFLYKMAWFFPDSYFAEPLLGMAEWGIKINIVLMVLNLLPLPPLDGGRVAVSLLPHRQAFQLARIEPYGMFILIFLVISGVLGLILLPLVNLMFNLISFLFGL